MIRSMTTILHAIILHSLTPFYSHAVTYFLIIILLLGLIQMRLHTTPPTPTGTQPQMWRDNKGELTEPILDAYVVLSLTNILDSYFRQS